MISRPWLLVRKEAREHAWALGLVGGALVLVIAMRWLMARLNDRAPSDMEGARELIVLFIPITGLVLGHRLVVREYQAKTQLFLEALPLRRWELVLVKFTFGLAVLSLLGWASLGVFALLSRDATPRFLLVAGLRTLGFATACWCLFFSFGLLGRLRFIAYVTLGLGSFALWALTSFEFSRFGPFALVDDISFTYDRGQIPWRALAETAALSVLLLAVGSFVALAREGSLAERLTRRASAREFSAVVALLCAELVGVGWAGLKRQEPPFEFTSKQVATSASGHVAVMYGSPELEPRGRALLRSLEALDARLRDEFAIGDSPTIRVAQNGLLDGREVHHSNASRLNAVLLETNLGARDFVPADVLMNVAHASFARASGGRAVFEPNHWLLDGFSSFLAIDPQSRDGEQRWLRAVVATRRFEASTQSIVEWEHLMERVGETHGDALAFTLVDFLQKRHGLARAVALAGPLLTRPSIQGLPSWLRLHNQTLERKFAELMQEPFAAFLRAWRRELQARAASSALAPRLDRVPLDTAELRLAAGPLGPQINYAVSGPALDRDRNCVLLHGLLRPYDIYYPPQELTKEEFQVARGQARFVGRLRGRYAAGQRVYAAIECEVPELASRQRLTVARLGAP